jgi:predicted KAP-like P-loop ATPase
VGDRAALRGELRGLAAQGLLGVAMDRMEAYKETIRLEHAVPFITALLDVGEDLPEDRSSFLEIAPDMHAIRIIYWFLRREQDASRKVEVLRRAINDSEGLYLAVMLISLEDDRQEKRRDPSERLVNESALTDLQKACVDKIVVAAAEGHLSTHPRLAYLLYRWKEWGVADEARAFVETLTRTPDGALQFVTAMLQRSMSQSVTDYIGRERWYIRLGNIEDFVRWEVVEESLQGVNVDSLAERQRRAVGAFRTAVRRRRRGLPDADGLRHLPEDDEAEEDLKVPDTVGEVTD